MRDVVEIDVLGLREEETHNVTAVDYNVPEAEVTVFVYKGRVVHVNVNDAAGAELVFREHSILDPSKHSNGPAALRCNRGPVVTEYAPFSPYGVRLSDSEIAVYIKGAVVLLWEQLWTEEGHLVRFFERGRSEFDTVDDYLLVITDREYQGIHALEDRFEIEYLPRVLLPAKEN